MPGIVDRNTHAGEQRFPLPPQPFQQQAERRGAHTASEPRGFSNEEIDINGTIGDFRQTDRYQLDAVDRLPPHVADRAAADRDEGMLAFWCSEELVEPTPKIAPPPHDMWGPKSSGRGVTRVGRIRQAPTSLQVRVDLTGVWAPRAHPLVV